MMNLSPIARIAAGLGLVLGITVSGCAGGFLSHRISPADLPKELPKDYQEKFEVKDTSEATPPVEPADSQKDEKATLVTATVKSNPRKREKKRRAPKIVKKAEAKPAAEIATAFEYPERRPANDPIQVGERHIFDITYFGMEAAQVQLEVLPFKVINGRKVYHVKARARTSKIFSLFYRVDDWLETYIDYDGLFSHRFHLVLNETKQTRDSLELYDSEKAQTFYWNRWNHKVKGYTETKNFFPMPRFPQDSLSALFYIRMLPLQVGKVFTFPVVSEGKSWDAVITVVRTEDLSTPIGRKRAFVLKLDAKYQGILKKKGDSFLWVSDDAQRNLLRLEAKVRIGTVVAALRKVDMLGADQLRSEE